MKTITTITAMLLLVMLAGCGTTGKKGSGQSGTGDTDPQFGFSVFDSFTIKQGATRPVDLLLIRGPDFTQDVRVSVKADGIDVSPGKPVIRAGENSVDRLQVVVPQNAAIGSYQVTVVGTPEHGHSVTVYFTVKVVAR